MAGIGASFMWDIATGPLLVCTFGGVLALAAVAKGVFKVRTGTQIEAPAAVTGPREAT